MIDPAYRFFADSGGGTNHVNDEVIIMDFDQRRHYSIRGPSSFLRLADEACEGSDAIEVLKRYMNELDPAVQTLNVDPNSYRKVHPSEQDPDVVMRLEELGGVSWFDIMSMECTFLETLSLGEGSGISREDLHYFLCRATHLRAVKLDRGNEHLLIDLVRPYLKSLEVHPEWMMRCDSCDILSQLHALEYLDVTIADATITSDKLLSLQSLSHLTHLHIWPTNNIGATKCTVTAAELVNLIEALPELVDLRIWLEFDFFCFEEAVQAAYDLLGRYPQFDNRENRQSPNLITMLRDDIHDWMPASPQAPHMDSRPSTVRRREAVLDTLKAIEQERYNSGCPYEDDHCRRYRSEVHNLVWHFDPYAPQLEPSPLLTQIGELPELAVRFIWHSPNHKRLLSTSISEKRVQEYAALVRHMVHTACTGKHLESNFSWGPGFSTTRPVPRLPGLTSLECESNSLRNRRIEELSTIFVPTLKRLIVQKYAAYDWDRPIHYHSQLEGVSWFDFMTENCPLLTCIKLGGGLHIDTATFKRFLKKAAHLTSVELGSGNEHLLVDELVPILKSTKLTISHHSYETNAINLGQIWKMHAIEDIELTVWNVCLTGSDVLEFKALTRLRSLQVYARGSPALTRCSASAEQLAQMIEAMPRLDEFKLEITCEFMESHPELLQDEWEAGTYFEGHSCRQQYLNYLHEIAEQERTIAVAVPDNLLLSS
ncbi:unnamed protein product [Aureobasidium mustum]|uniref:RNI-like protein n=1 Tax=Aureobasidium mustum TaxID=2773714 RepID=A0A9N8K0Z2_9PEZI|nr:unnamed protein product [Aureobasidium mustum]